MASLVHFPAEGLSVDPQGDVCAFIAASQFDGPKEGYVFQLGPSGQGYYKSAKNSVSAANQLGGSPTSVRGGASAGAAAELAGAGVPHSGAHASVEAALDQPLSGGGGPDGRDYSIPDKAFARGFAKLRVTAVTRALAELGLPNLPENASLAYSCTVRYEHSASEAEGNKSTADDSANGAEQDVLDHSIVCNWPSTPSGEAENRCEAGFTIVMQFERAWKAQFGPLRSAKRLMVVSLAAEITVPPHE